MTARSLIVAGNWKMNLGLAEGLALADALAAKTALLKSTRVWVAPSFPHLEPLARRLQGSKVVLGGQNVSWERKGALTGEVSAAMLLEIGVQFAIVGHSERRQLLHEDDAMVARRTTAALDQRLDVIFCIGENLAQRDGGETEAVLERQIQALLDLRSHGLTKLIVAYEPVWAIGSGRAATVEIIAEAHARIKEIFRSKAQLPDVPVLYGGSVTPDNFAEIASCPVVDGALVGGASIDKEKFTKLLELAEPQSLGHSR